MSKYILETHNLSKQYGEQKAVNQINMHVPKGCIYALLGRNGAGKTTTLRMIMNLIKPTSGRISLFGDYRKENFARVGSIIENPGFYPNLTGRENLEIMARLRGVHRKDAVEYALKRVGLDKETQKKVSQYSLGMKQRLGIAASIMHEPEILILDEPINGLDPIGIQEMRNFLVDLCREKQVTILISSHILGEIEQIADVIGVIHKGELLEEISMEELRKKNRKYMEFQVSNENKVAMLLEQQFNITDYEVHENGSVRVYSHLGKQADLNKVFVNHDIDVYKINMSEDKLEDYFSKLIGGGTIG